jgi:formamidopyrimidine-DNA glycosylase
VPELPEVEVLRRSLEPELLGERFADVEVACSALREPVSRRQLAARLRGRAIVGLRRRAKYLWIDTEGESTLVVHLGMSGRLTLSADGARPEPHEHVRFSLSSGRRLRFRDPRRFGLVLALRSDRLESDPHFAHLGLEPLSAALDGPSLRRLASGRRAPVKSFLMDGRIVVGVGNIYASEALHRAGIHPLRSVARISARRWDALASSIHSVLEDAIREGGTTLNDFTDGRGASGYFQVSLAAYGRDGEDCRRCGGAIRRIVLGGRSTYYCPRCQR